MKGIVFIAGALAFCACSSPSSPSNANPQTLGSNKRLTSAARFQSGSEPAVIAGEVGEDGTIVGGDGFTVQHVRRGEYLIYLDPGWFPLGCAAMTVTDVGTKMGPPIGEVQRQTQCGGYFRVTFYLPISDRQNQAFNFIAVQEL